MILIIDAARIYLEARGGLAREKAYVEGFADKPALIETAICCGLFWVFVRVPLALECGLI